MKLLIWSQCSSYENYNIIIKVIIIIINIIIIVIIIIITIISVIIIVIITQTRKLHTIT